MTEQVKTAPERATRKIRKGKVISKSGDKSIVVLVERRYQHPLYGKTLTAVKKMHTHDPKNEAEVGDFVEIRECRPLSRLKRWHLVKVERTVMPAEGDK